MARRRGRKRRDTVRYPGGQVRYDWPGPTDELLAHRAALVGLTADYKGLRDQRFGSLFGLWWLAGEFKRFDSPEEVYDAACRLVKLSAEVNAMLCGPAWPKALDMSGVSGASLAAEDEERYARVMRQWSRALVILGNMDSAGKHRRATLAAARNEEPEEGKDLALAGVEELARTHARQDRKAA